jgi:GNAT superfamily N-acetyltransferase
MTALTIRSPREDDRTEWQSLWTDYLDFYDTSVSANVYDETWRRFFSQEPYDPRCFVAQAQGRLVGLVHYMAHRHCWRTENVIYLQDLFVSADARGTGAGRALIEAVYGEADRSGTPSVYWMTQDFNETARQLYDRIATLTPFIKYQR